ncbi:glutathione synthetase [Buchnera aphidicola str. Bp (Baizongia pistaciae)]|uniref:Glutathione synthetase n=1 Tax=Buchnera aphidicola subsp. Baizongia pistaciae (strain Bp) TaxID=224915 RepID=GSHB_BUCBP|nr:glutathione synthase [Buchnera aphidicola]P59495.1 RecName: Full=Glutathione synthetase; AltName: Full=GSH synthetase; Short=GSH-S; Short=GSHase; AltName: Full=Glutathione synthase [Buchnera aphidicola str. Bp (Baizongia pistaciae)]AAO27195.1 glutathione synthetase [Buchnera aphidicola str. Bp (Baizongia pistaciae)]
MTINLGIIMDPISSINIKKDSSFAILLEAQNRKYKIYYMELKDLYLKDNKPYSHTKLLRIKNNKKQWFTLEQQKDVSLSNLDVILMRKNPPINRAYIYATYILEQAERNGSYIINKPSSLRSYNEKLFTTTHFPQYIPKTLITSNSTKIHNFIKTYKDIIIKPLHGMAGLSIFRIKEHDPNTSVIIETMTKYETIPCISQNYITDIQKGDKRILIINGIPFPWCLARIPKKHENRGNLSIGGYGNTQKLSKNDWEIALSIAPTLNKKGIFFAGIDIIGTKLTEINITSPTCIQEIEQDTGISISTIILDNLEKNLKKRKTNRYL